MNECRHMIGLEFIPYEGGWPIYEKLGYASDVEYFKFCPTCGKKLEVPDEIPKD